jgi:hypothetical protein
LEGYGQGRAVHHGVLVLVGEAVHGGRR